MSIKKIGQNLAGIPKLQSGGKVQETYIKKLPEKFSEFDFLFSDAPNIINNGANHVGIMTNVANQYNTELGDPNIEVTKIQRGTRPVDQGRAYYRPWDNEMVIEESLPFLDQWIAELSHAKQYQVDKTGYELHDFQDKVIEGFRAQHPELAELSRADIVDRIAYDTPGTVEHDAHRVIEPKLGHEYVNRVFKQYWANHVVPELQNTLDIKKERGDIPSFDDVRSKAYKDWSTKAAAITNKISPEVLSDTFKYDLDKGKTEKLFKEIVKIQAPPRSEMEALQSRITEADGKYDEGLVHEVLSTIRTSAPKLQTGGKINTNMRKKFQLGGLNAFNNIDFSSFDSVLEAGRPMVGSILGDAAQADNPEMFTNQMVKRLGNQAAANSAEEYWTQERDKALALTTNNRVRKQIEEDFNKNKEEVMQNYTTTQGATNFTDAQSGFMDATGFLDLLSGLQFNTGGNLRSKLGYSDNSPFKSLGSIDIDGNVIDMSRTGKTLLATPDVGEPRELKPYSGTHVFPGATKVTETPIKAKGGKAKAQKWLNNYYQEGGQGAIGAQLEVGEVFATPDANIIDTAATEKHKDMVKDLVTDILGGADYVFSAMDRMKITRKEAENISFGLGGQLYKEGEIPEMPKEVLLSDLFKEGEDEVQIAEFVKRVRTRYPVTDKEDVFSKKANAGNKQSRGPLLSAIAFINEKKRGGNGAGGYASTYENKFNNGISTDANPIKDDISHSAYEVTVPGEPPKGQLGGFLNLIPFVGGLVQGIGQLGSARNNRRDVTKLLAEDRELIKEQASTSRGYAGLATGLNVLGYTEPDPTILSPQYDTTQLDSSIRKVPRTLFDFASARLAAAAKPRLDQLFANSGSFSEAVNLSGGDAAANASAIANLGINEVQQNIQMENNYRMQKQGYSDKQITADVAAANATRGNSNRLIAGAAGALSGGVTAQGTITNQEQSALRNNNYQQTKNTVDWRAAKNDAWTNIINNVGGASTAISGSGILSRNPDDGVSESANPNTVQGAPEIPWESPDYFSLLQPTQTTITQPLPAAGMTPRPGVPTMQQQMITNSVPGSGWTQDPVTGGWFPPGWVK